MRPFPCEGIRQHERKQAMDRFEFSDNIRYHKLCHRLLPGLELKMDATLSVINGYITIDIMALDNKLKEMFPKEWEYMSIRDIIELKYSKDAVDFINALL